MSNVISIKSTKAKRKVIEQICFPEETRKLSHATLYNYHSNLMMCEKLFLVNTGEFPSAEELVQMHVSDARKIIRKLNKIFEEMAEKRHMKLTGKTMARAAVDKLDIYFKN